jgi:hypothetical protein
MFWMEKAPDSEDFKCPMHCFDAYRASAHKTRLSAVMSVRPSA